MKDIKSCFREDFDQWIESSNLAYRIDGTGGKIKKSPMEIEAAKAKALEEIKEVLREHPDADYFWYTYTGERLVWTVPAEEPQPVPSDSLRTVNGMAKILIREDRLKELGI